MLTHPFRLFLLTAQLLFLFSCSYAQKGQQLTPVEFSKRIADDDAQVLDVRGADEYEKEHIADASNIDWNGDSFEEETSTLDKEKPVYIYCNSGNRSAKAAMHLRKAGFKNVYELKGGMTAWEREVLRKAPAEKKEKDDTSEKDEEE